VHVDQQAEAVFLHNMVSPQPSHPVQQPLTYISGQLFVDEIQSGAIPHLAMLHAFVAFK
jgi:hypothetical protein